MQPENDERSVSDDGISKALEKVTRSASFARSDQLRRLLEHIVRETREGRRDRLLGKNIASDVFGLDIDETTDLSGVRVEIGRLRARLRHYYQTEGTTDPIAIDIPKGSYVATFTPGRAPGQRGRRRLHWQRVKDTCTSFSRKLLRPAGVMAASAVAAALISGAIIVKAPRSEPPPPSTLPLVAVSKIENLSGEADYLADGLTADLVNRLARFNHLVIVSRAATALAGAQATGAVALGQQLDADYQLAGALQDGTDGQRLTLELLSVPDGEVLWVGEYALPETGPELMTARLEAANSIALRLASRDGVVARLEASESDRAASRTSYLCVLRYYAYLQRRTPAEHAEVRDCLESAGRETPDYAEVWSSLAQLYLDERRNGFTAGAAPGDPVDRAIDAATRAVTLAPDSASAQSVFAAAHYFGRNIPAFRDAARRSLELNPNDPDAHAYLGHLLSMSGAWEEGQRLVAEAKAMSPVHPPLWHHSTAMAAMLDQDYERARREAERGEMPSFYMSYVLLAAIHGHLGNRPDAREAVKKLEGLRPDYLANIEADMQRRHFQPALIENFQRGLAKAYSMEDSR